MLIERAGPLFRGVQRSVMTRLSLKERLLKHAAVIWLRATIDIIGGTPTNTRFNFLSVSPELTETHGNVTIIRSTPTKPIALRVNLKPSSKDHQYNRHAVRLTYRSGIDQSHLQGAKSRQVLVMHAWP
jgi:hypothetical protein